MVRDIDARTLKNWIDSNKEIILIDTRDLKDYQNSHIKGAVSLLLSDVDKRATKNLKPDIPVVVYSNGINCPASGLVSKKLDSLGYGTVYNYNPSFADWVNHNFPVVK
jgi:rhodanese-related sulfurtransferase